MAFALATGRWMTELAESDLLARTGFGTIQTAQDHPDWRIACDAMSQLSPLPQPAAEASRWRVAFDGHLANGDAIAESLRLNPELGKTDPACIVAALLQGRGPDALDQLTGSFAVIAGHCDSGIVVAMRDRTGGSTLYYAGTGQGFVVATRSAWALRLTRQNFEPDRDFLVSHFALHTAPPPGHSAFAKVTELMPGEHLTLESGKIGIQRRELDLTRDFDYRHPGDCIARFRELLVQAVRTSLPAEGSVACMLSGGLDSGPIAAIADRELARTGRMLQICSWELPEFPEADEGHWIRVAGRTLSQPLDLFDGSGLVPFSRTDSSTIVSDLPHYSAFRLLVNECYRRAAGHGCRVIFNGNDGDQIYPLLAQLNLDRLKRRQWRPIWLDLVRAWRSGGVQGIFTHPAYRHPLGLLLRPFRRTIGLPEWIPEEFSMSREYPTRWPPELEQLAFPKYGWQLLGSRMAFGHAHDNEFPSRFGLARRDPYRNEALLRFMLHAPFSQSHRRGWDKWLMRQATRGLIDEQLRRKRRTGLLHSFFRFGLRSQRAELHHLLFKRQTGWQQFVKPEVIERILREDEHPNEILVARCVGHALWMNHWGA